jgi:hypothetical protein
MQLDQMRGWLKALVVLVALAAGFPAAAWAHPGHEHGGQSFSPRAVSSPIAVSPVKWATDNRDSFTPGQLTAGGFVVCVTSPSSGQRIAHAAKSAGRSQVDRSRLGATPADGPAEPVDQNSCCCGGLACHAGMAAPTLTVTDPWTLAAKIVSPPVLALAGAVPGGIERPPRGSIPL